MDSRSCDSCRQIPFDLFIKEHSSHVLFPSRADLIASSETGCHTCTLFNASLTAPWSARGCLAWPSVEIEDAVVLRNSGALLAVTCGKIKSGDGFTEPKTGSTVGWFDGVLCRAIGDFAHAGQSVILFSALGHQIRTFKVSLLPYCSTNRKQMSVSCESRRCTTIVCSELLNSVSLLWLGHPCTIECPSRCFWCLRDIFRKESQTVLIS